jgi:ubiquitin C-terminal hydrolase|tara:strand:+ start:448 stop:804 length:357 start_codon:yes stop_codon:yes gene_type:complete
VQGEMDRVETYDASCESKKMDVSIDDCFEEFKKPEILDADNMWYCNKCKTHVQATKKIEIYKVPPIMVVSLKRFKQEKQRNTGFLSMYSGGGGGQKIDDQVDFPLEGLDMSKYIVGGE